jgi:mono/diheme cytochrome c family protein
MRHFGAFILAFGVASSAGLEPGLLVKATDRELTVPFVVPQPNVILRGNESIHPQLKPSFSGEFSGFLLVSTGAQYTLTGAPEILVDGKNVAGKITLLPAGERRLRIPFKRNGRGDFAIALKWQMDDAEEIRIPATNFAHGRAPRELAENVSRDLGRKLFEDNNCGACHTPEHAAIRFSSITNGAATKPLRSLRPTEGCLSEAPEADVPKFSMSEAEREGMQLFVQSPDVSPAPLHDLPRMFSQLSCQKCHALEALGTVAQLEEIWKTHEAKAFVTNMASADWRRLAELLRSQVATNGPKP